MIFTSAPYDEKKPRRHEGNHEDHENFFQGFLVSPVRACLDGRQGTLGQFQVHQRLFHLFHSDTGNPASEPAAISDERGAHLLAVTPAQKAAQIVHPVRQAKRHGLFSIPIFPREQGRFLALQPVATPFLHQGNKSLVNILLDRLQAPHVVGIFRQEGIEHDLAFARGIHTAFDAELLDRLVEAEGGAHDADGTEDRGSIAEDFIGRAGDHVAAGGADILDEGQHGNLLFVRQLADAPVDQMRLHRRTARRIDNQRHGFRLFDAEGALEVARRRGDREARLERRRKADGAGQSHHGDNGNATAPFLRKKLVDPFVHAASSL